MNQPANTRTVLHAKGTGPQIRSGFTHQYGYVELDMYFTGIELDDIAAEAVESLFREISSEPLPPRFVLDFTRRHYSHIGHTVVAHRRIKKPEIDHAVATLHTIALQCIERKEEAIA